MKLRTPSWRRHCFLLRHFSVNAATELTPGKAAAVKPFDRVVVAVVLMLLAKRVKVLLSSRR